MCKLEILIFMLVPVYFFDHLIDSKAANKFLSFYLLFQFHRTNFLR